MNSVNIMNMFSTGTDFSKKTQPKNKDAKKTQKRKNPKTQKHTGYYPGCQARAQLTIYIYIYIHTYRYKHTHTHTHTHTHKYIHMYTKF